MVVFSGPAQGGVISLTDPISRLLACAEALLSVDKKSASDILGFPDDLKLKSSMTLFDSVTGAGSLFGEVLEKYYAGERDELTKRILSFS